MNTLNIFSNRFMKAVVTAAVCAFMLLGTAYPAMAFGSSASDSSQGVVEMNEMKETSKDAVRQAPRGRQAVQNKAKRGPNAVQGNANLEKMNRSANSSQARTVEGQAEDILEDITPGS